MVDRTESLQKSMTSTPAFDGLPANIFVLKNRQGMQITLMDIGATWLSCEIPVANELRQVLLGVQSMKDHLQQTTYLGATVGRYANRIAAGTFSIGSEKYHLSLNQAGNTLHGGIDAFDKRRWKVEKSNEDTVIFSLTSKDGDQGFPGNLQVVATYHLSDSNELSIKYKANTDKACPVNLTNHAYFNLQGKGEASCLQHQLRIMAQEYLPVNDVGIPFGHFNSVIGSCFDFRQLKEIGKDFLSCEEQKIAGGYDHSFILDKACESMNKAAVECVSPDALLSLEIMTTKPAVQLYTGNFLSGTPNRCGGQYENYCAFALETQFLPDAPNHTDWPQPDCILQPNHDYCHETCYRFITADKNIND